MTESTDDPRDLISESGGHRREPILGGSQVRYLDVGTDWIHARYHRAVGHADVAVVFCPPFGFDEVCSQRPLRAWAEQLAAAGYPCLRAWYPGVGDSAGGPWDPDRLDAWTRSVELSARWLQATSGAGSVVAVGIGLGGLVAYRAASTSGPIAGLVLWATPTRGANLVRQLRAFSRMESSEFYPDGEPPEDLPEGAVEAGGFVMSPETVTALKRLDLDAMPTPALPLGVLALTLDGVEPSRLLETLRTHGLSVTEADGSGYGAMTADPQLAEVPEVAARSVGAWLKSRSRRRTPGGERDISRALDDLPTDSDELHLDGGATERDWTLQTPAGRMRGILTRPDDDVAPLCAIFLNAGGVSHVGPNRMWVETARRWTERGVAALRVDLPGLGESEGPATAYPENAGFYTEELIGCVRETIEKLARDGVAERFVLVGLCSGAYWALHAGVEEERVAGIILLNPVVIHWDSGLAASRDLRRVFTDRSWRLIRKNATPERVGAVARLLVSTPSRALDRIRHGRVGGQLSLQAQVDATLERLRFAETRLFAAFSIREGLADELERTGWMAQLSVWPNVTVRRIRVNDHTFRPVAMQKLLRVELDDEIGRVLGVRRTQTRQAGPGQPTSPHGAAQEGHPGSGHKNVVVASAETLNEAHRTRRHRQ